MASDDYDIDMDWDSDPFAGDIDFDMDFDMDPFAKRGFVKSFASGFLSGVVDETVGTTQNRFRSLRTILPSTFSTALDKATFLHDRLDELALEFREENAQSAKSLQNIASHLNQRMGAKLPGFMQDGLTNFSSKDFSSWERLDSNGGNFNARLDSTSESEVDNAIDNSIHSQSSMFASLGETINSMTAATTSVLQSAIGAGNRQLVNIEGAMRDMLNYQRNVDARLQQAQLNLLARSYVQDAKYYKFMEAGTHASVTELKKISKYTGMSDFEKTSTYTASKAYLRDKVFSTMGKRVGGVTGLLRDRLGAENRKDAYGAFGSIIDGVNDAIEMSDGGAMSKGMIGNILGRMAAGVAVEKMPAFFTRGPGKKAIDRMAKLYPEQAKYIQEQVDKLTDIGNVVSYASTSGVGMLNYMAQDYQAMDEMKFLDYEDYVDSLPPGKKPLPKSAWTILNASGNKAKSAINKLMSDTTKSRGTQYVLKRRNVKDLNQPGIWKEINNITLNEVLPGLLTRTNQILEQLRTGSDKVEAVSYNYMRGEFQSDSKKRVSVQADLMPHGDFQRYAQASLNMVDSLNPDKMLSGSTRKAFAQVISKDIDAELGFNPYYYLGDIKGMSAAATKEVHAMLMRHFGITTTDVQSFKNGDSLERMKKMSHLPTAEGRERLNTASSAASNIKSAFPNVAERIDLLRATGNEQMLRDLGVIYTENGMDKINMDAFHDRIGMYMDDPDNPLLRGVTPNDPAPGKTRNRGLGGRRNKGGRISPAAGSRTDLGPSNDSDPYADLTRSLSQLTEKLGSLPTGESTGNRVNWDAGTGVITEINTGVQGILGKATNIEALLSTAVEMIKAGKLLTGNSDNKSTERQEEQAKKSLLDRVKGMMPKNMVGRGLDSIMNTNPMVLGGILGAFGAALAPHNWMVSGGIAAAGLLAGAAVNMYRNRGQGGTQAGEAPSDDEDILDETGEPLLKAAKLKAGQYLDATTRRVIKTWNDIRGPIIDVTTKAVIGVRDLAGKIFGPDGRARVLSGLRRVRDASVAGFNALDPIGRLKAAAQFGKETLYQQDVYLKGDLSEPVLRAKLFKSGEYFGKDESGNFKPIMGWNEINGAVYDNEGNQLVSEEEYQSGLVTATGAAIRNVGGLAANMVGAAAGLGRSGLNSVLGRFGINTPGAGGEANASGAASTGPNGVERRLDKIYRMLSQHFDIPMENDPFSGEKEHSDTTGHSDSPGLRLGSLDWKKKESDKEERHKVNKAIIEIAENTKGMGEEKDDKGEPQGIFGKLKGILGGLLGFFPKLIKNPIGTIGGLIFGSLGKSTERLVKIGSALFSGVLGAASPIYNLLKAGFTKLAGAFLGRRLGGGGSGDDDGPDQRGQGTRRDRARDRLRRRRQNQGGRGRRGMRKLGGLAAMGASYLGSKAIDSAFNDDGDDLETGYEDMEAGDRDPATGNYKTKMDSVMETVTDWLPQGMLAKSAVEGVLGKDGMMDLDDKGLFWTSEGEFFFSRKKASDRQAVIDGKPVINAAPGVMKANTKITTQKKVRMAMYGIQGGDNNLARRIMGLENELYQWVEIKDNRAAFKKDTPVAQLVDNFANSGVSKWSDKSQISAWFLSRFKPIFLVYNAAVAVARMGDLVEFDNAKTYDVVQVIERVQRTVAQLNPPPYSIDVRIDDKEGTMGAEQTRDAIAKLVEELKKELPAPPKVDDKLSGASDQIQQGKNTPAGTTPTSLPEMAAQSKLGAAAAGASARAAANEFKQPADVTTIDISDLLPKANKNMDPFTAVRLAVYGNIDNMTWRVEAVLRLERYMENFILITGNDTRFTGKSNQVMELFAASFRLKSDISKNNWSLWFRDRFLPTLMEYSKLVNQYQGGKPSVNWKALSATNQAIIARKLTALIVSTTEAQKPVWEILASPFPDSQSGQWSDRADRYLKILDAAAQEARLKDPEMEDMKSAPTSKINEPVQRAQAAQVRDKTQQVLNSVYRTGNVGGAFPGVGMQNASAAQMGGYTPNATMSAPGGGAGSAGAFMGKADSNFNPEFIKKAGADKGIKMSLEQGEKLMLNHLVKAGFRDNKTLALALAMAKKETGGYQSTVENTNWSAPTLLKYFKNVPDAATAQKVAAMSPVERAMWVYGRAPKGPQLGNTKPEDGWTYRGRGLFQLTGKANYEAFKKASGIDVVAHPELVSEDPNVMAESAVWYLKNNAAMKAIAQNGDFDTAVRGINGGNTVPATDERRGFYNDYLNRLRSGDLDMGGGGDDSEAAASTDSAIQGGTQPQVPAAADKNVPPSAKPTGKGAVADLLNQTGASSAPSNAGTSSSTANASAMSAPSEASGGVTPSGTSSASSATSSGPAPASKSTPPASSSASAASTPAPVAQQPAPQPAPQSPSVEFPDSMSTQDKLLAELAKANGQTLVAILKELQKANRQQPSTVNT